MGVVETPLRMGSWNHASQTAGEPGKELRQKRAPGSGSPVGRAPGARGTEASAQGPRRPEPRTQGGQRQRDTGRGVGRGVVCRANEDRRRELCLCHQPVLQWQASCGRARCQPQGPAASGQESSPPHSSHLGLPGLTLGRCQNKARPALSHRAPVRATFLLFQSCIQVSSQQAEAAELRHNVGTCAYVCIFFFFMARK